MGGKVSKEPRPRFVVPTQRVKNLFKRGGEKCPPYILMNSIDTVKNENDSETRLQILENQLQQTMMDLEYSRSQIGYLQAIQQDHEKLLNETSSSKSVLDSILAENKQLVSENKQLSVKNKQLSDDIEYLMKRNRDLVYANEVSHETISELRAELDTWNHGMSRLSNYKIIKYDQNYYINY